MKWWACLVVSLLAASACAPVSAPAVPVIRTPTPSPTWTRQPTITPSPTYTPVLVIVFNPTGTATLVPLTHSFPPPSEWLTTTFTPNPSTLVTPMILPRTGISFKSGASMVLLVGLCVVAMGTLLLLRER